MTITPIISLVLSVAVAVAGGGMAFGILHGKVTALRETVKALKDEKASIERINGIEALILQRLSGIEAKLAVMSGETTSPGHRP